jgi:hypothetical protein
VTWLTWLFLALEAAIVAIADKHGIDTQKQHWKKADTAAELHRTGVLPHDFSSTLRLLNEAARLRRMKATSQNSTETRLRTSPLTWRRRLSWRSGRCRSDSP